MQWLHTSSAKSKPSPAKLHHIVNGFTTLFLEVTNGSVMDERSNNKIPSSLEIKAQLHLRTCMQKQANFATDSHTRIQMHTTMVHEVAWSKAGSCDCCHCAWQHEAFAQWAFENWREKEWHVHSVHPSMNQSRPKIQRSRQRNLRNGTNKNTDRKSGTTCIKCFLNGK